jgi:transposase
MTIETLGVDIAKNVFQLHGVNRNGHVVLKRRVMRDQLLSTLTQIERCTVVIEACTGAFYWARKFEAFGHEVKIISPQYVKPFVRRQKNDGNDAEAICTAARQPHIPFVPKKTIEQQDIQALHRARQRMVNHRTAVVSQIRGLLLDRGFAIAKSITRARRVIPEILSDLENELTGMVREALAELFSAISIAGSVCSIRRSIGSSVRTRIVNASPGSRASARRQPRRLSPPLATGQSSRMGGI